jgi:hypothetical protein
LGTFLGTFSAVAEAGNAPSFELVFELLDLPEKQNAALTSTVSKGWGLRDVQGFG